MAASWLGKMKRAMASEAEFQALAGKYRMRGHVYAQPLLNFRVKAGGEFVDLTTGKEIKLGYAKDRIRRQLEEDARLRDAAEAAPTAPTIPPSPGDVTRPERAAAAIPMPPLPGNEPEALAPVVSSAPVFAMDGGDESGASDSVVGRASGASSSSSTTGLLVGVGVLALLIYFTRSKR